MSDSLADPLTFSSREHSTTASPRRLHNEAVVFSQIWARLDASSMSSISQLESYYQKLWKLRES
jgi:hypothetical protein